MRFLFVLPALLLVAAPAVADDDFKPEGSEKIVSRDAKLTPLFTRTANIKGGLTEGPACAPDGSIYFSDIPFGKDKGMIMRYNPKTGKTIVFIDDSHKSNGLKFDAKGYLIACEGSDQGGMCVSRWDIENKKRTVIADKYMGKRFNAPNDLAIDLKGRIYFTDPRYLGEEPRQLKHMAVYRIEKDGKVIEITHDCEKPNGIALSPDMKSLYVVDHNNGTDQIDPDKPAPKKGAMKLYKFALDKNGLVEGERKTIIDFGGEDGIDGMCVDVKGNLYMAVRSLKRPGVWISDKDGKELAYIRTGPEKQDPKKPKGIPANVCFGRGKDSKTLYVTVDTSLYSIPVKIDGWHLPLEK
jgi:gluconolactonase